MKKTKENGREKKRIEEKWRRRNEKVREEDIPA